MQLRRCLDFARGLCRRCGRRAGSAIGMVVAALSLSLSIPAVAAGRDGVRPDEQLARWLSDQKIDPANAAVVAIPVDGGRPLLELNPRRPFNPASTMKLLTTHAALSVLGPAYRWHTDALLRGELRDGRLAGDLVLRGGGDPKLVIEDLEQFVAAMREAGLRQIDGDLVVDDGVFDVGVASVESFDGDPTQPYNVRPFGLLMNFKATRLVVRPDAKGAQVSLDPALDGVQIDNRLRLRRGGCKAGSNVLAVSELGGVRASGAARRDPTLVVRGSYSPSCGEFGTFVSVLDHREFIDGLFRAAWRAAGGVWHGRTRIERGAQGRDWLRWDSPRTLADVVRDINKFSNNVMARQVLLQLAYESGARPATQADARRVLAEWIDRQRISLSGLVVENGSGLSRSARISASGMANLLVHAAAASHAELLRDSLPVVGIDGTMKYRMAGEALAGRAWIKTGSLSQVRTIAGYLQARSGKRYALVCFYNGPHPAAIGAVQEKLLRWVYLNG